LEKRSLEAVYKVAIVGAGIGGSYLSYRLAKQGLETITFDFRVPHEKLCGGGITHKAMERFSVLSDLPCPRKEVWKAIIISPNNRAAAIDLTRPLTIFNRRDLDYSLLLKAQETGAEFKRERVRSFAQEGHHWRIRTEKGEYRAEKLVGADGTLSGTRRRLRLPLKLDDCYLALQCTLPVQEDAVTFQFFPHIYGYLWAFPRVDGLVVGIVSKTWTPVVRKVMKENLFAFIDQHYPGSADSISLRGAYIPFFAEADYEDQAICSENWALIGDAARFVDPISGEGMYYALYSADILADCIVEDKILEYAGLCRERFGGNLLKASRGFPYIYQTEFIDAMTVLAGKSRPIRQIISEMMVGDLNYLNWKGRFKRNSLRIITEFLLKSDYATKRELMASLSSLRTFHFRDVPRPRTS
jgi:geranylgeranyl reductase family protein